MAESLLTEAQKRAIEPLSHSISKPLRRRAQVLLLYNAGKETPEVAAEVGLSIGRARYWKRQFINRGMEIFSRARRTAGADEQKPPERALAPVPAGQAVSLAVPEARIKALSGPIAPAGLAQAPAAEVKPAPAPAPVPAPVPATPRKNPYILPADCLAEAGRKVMAHFFDEMLRHEDGTRRGEDIEELHDMRVSTRRLRVAMDLFSPAFAPKTIKRHLKGLRAAGRALGQVRDLDVLIEETQEDLADRSQKKQRHLAPLLEAWQAARDAARLRMLDHLNCLDYWEFKRRYTQFTSPVGMEPCPPEGEMPQGSETDEGAASPEEAPSPVLAAETPICKAAAAIIRQRLEAVRAYNAVLPEATFDQMHQLRIEIKKLRYTLEFLYEILPPEASALVRQLRIVQDHLGKINDTRVAIGLIGDFLQAFEARQAALPLGEWQNPQAIAAYLAEKQGLRHELAHSFIDTWTAFNDPALQQRFDQLAAELECLSK